MTLLSEILGSIGSLCIEIISSLGYFGIVLLMTFESMIVPLPSELVMPFAGFLAGTKEMNFLWVVIFSTLGSLIGSLLSYYLGKWGGQKIVLKFGKYLLLDEEDLIKTEEWFAKKGEATVFIARFVPIVRHLISIPAGIGKMDLTKFIIYTTLGATGWNAFLAYLGFLLGKNWESVKHYAEYISVPTLLIIIVLGGYFVWRHVGHKRSLSPLEKGG